MSVKVRWILASLLCLCTLVALWATGARVRAKKMAARYGDRTAAAPTDAAGTSTVTLRRDQKVKVGHFVLEFSKGETVRVCDAAGAVLVEFPELSRGDLRRWQELQLAFIEVGPGTAKAEVEFKPGSPCFGSGRYRALRQGLQIQFPGGRSVTIAAWDAAKLETTIRIEAPSGNVEIGLQPGYGPGKAFEIAWKFEVDPSGGAILDLRDLK